jgi:hypothetical protein
MMRKQDRLGPLQVGISRHEYSEIFPRHPYESLLQV